MSVSKVMRLAALMLIAGPLVLHPAGARADDKDVEHAGDVMRVALPVLAGGISLMKDDEEGVVQLIKSFAVSSALTFGLQKAIKATPPDGIGRDSFPSGHSANAFSAASYLDHRYGWRYGLPAYLAAGFVAYSRVEADKHRVHDVAAAAFISWTVSHIFVKPLPVETGAEPRKGGALLRISTSW